MALKVHAHAGFVAGSAQGLCGHFAVRTTTDALAVTCETCKKKLRQLHDEKLRAEGIDYLERYVTIHEQGPSGSVKAKRVKRAVMAREGVEGILDKLSGRWEGKHKAPRLETRYSGITHALQHMVAADLDGFGGASLSDPDRMERLSGRMGGPSSTRGDTREETEAHDLHAVRSAWRGAFTGWDPAPLTTTEARAATLMRYVGENVHREGLIRRSPTEIAVKLSERSNTEITPKAVGRATRQAGQRIYEYLRERELVPERRPYLTPREAEDMALGGYDYTGWKEIADALGVHEATARRWHGREDDPLPIHPIGGQVRARATELEEWLEREAERNRKAGAA